MPVGNVHPTAAQAVADEEEEWAAQARPAWPTRQGEGIPSPQFIGCYLRRQNRHRTVRVVVAVVGRLL